eukprot:CAMPEP_0113946950 /NCGR_PEP_ID=MMETSP1339-20121228/61272_1 /TAXON_ID=94617 /ORGANISM="Fibrocapsa japonica" /LENGTH=74 /DNA_ID=CAMNT_0000953285 /DNA_START=114 /DNA_END=335 /DNA_ORIENTATION=- /assembly_acc=CAM_ASM_000762
MGNSIGSATLAFYFLFAGFFTPRSEIPPWWIWCHYISPFKYAFESLALNVYNKVDSPAIEAELQRLDLDNTNTW